MHAPTTTIRDETRQFTVAHNIHILSRKHLIITISHDTIREVWEGHTRGGHCARYGLLNSRGGSKRTEIFPGYSQEDAAQQRNARIQIRQGLAHRSDRIRGMEKDKKESVQRTGSGELINDLASAATQRTAITIATRLTERCQVSLPHIHYTDIWQHMARFMRPYSGSWAAVEGIYPMTIYTPRVVETGQRIHLYDNTGNLIAKVTSEKLAELAECEMLATTPGEVYESLPQACLNAEGSAFLEGLCAECGKECRECGIFCMGCFAHLCKYLPDWASRWYGGDWDEALMAAGSRERVEVSYAAAD